MLSFLQGSRSRSTPVHLYEVTYGPSVGSKLFLTDAEENITFQGNVYVTSMIKHGEIHASGTLDNTTLDVMSRYDSPISRLFNGYPPGQEVAMVIRRGERDDPDKEFLQVWAGRILSHSTEGYESKFTCEPKGTAIRRPGLRRNYQYGCPHVLYGPSCRADRAAHSRYIEIINASGAVLLLSPGWHGEWPAAQFINGLASWADIEGNPVQRTILRVVDSGGQTSMLLAGEATDLGVASVIYISLGCNHQMSDCSEIFQNMPNYGGHPWIPTKNPIGSYNPFY